MKKHALVTGGSGFLGRYVVQALQAAGYTVTSLGRKAQDEADINLHVDLAKDFELPAQTYHLVVHAAGKAHMVPKREAEVQAFHQVNREGTRHLLAALDAQPSEHRPEALVLVSTVSVYGKDKGLNLPETSPLESKEPYGLSKQAAEELVRSWSKQHGIPATILRLPLVVGHEAPGNLGAMVKAMRKGRFFNIAGGDARRSMVLAYDVAQAIPKAARFPGTYNLTDGQHPTFAEMAKVIAHVRDYRAARNLPGVVAGAAGLAGSTLEKITGKRMPFSWRTFRKMTADLTFSDAKAREAWGWEPHSVLKHPEYWL